MLTGFSSTSAGSIVLLMMVGVPSIARGQPSASTPIRTFVSANVGVARPAAGSFSNIAFVTDGFDRDEVRADYTVKQSAALDIGGGVILGPGVILGLAISHAAGTQPADLTLTLTHPEFHPTLTATTRTEALRHSETGVHLQFGYALPTFKRMDVLLFGGPSHFRVSQPVIEDFMFDETFNPSTRTFSAVITDPVVETQKGSAWGYHVGTDVSYRVNERIGLGALVRYSRATVGLENPLQSIIRNREAVEDIDVGGLQVTTGVRLRF